jgi:hypothetical protein
MGLQTQEAITMEIRAALLLIVMSIAACSQRAVPPSALDRYATFTIYIGEPGAAQRTSLTCFARMNPDGSFVADKDGLICQDRLDKEIVRPGEITALKVEMSPVTSADTPHTP